MSIENEGKELVCINCPAGCLLQVTEKDGEYQVTGNRCGRGPKYAVQELTDPRRVLTVLMPVEGCAKPISVKTSQAVPKDMLMDCAREIYRHPAKGPVKAGEVVLEDLLGTGADVIATRDSDR